MRHHPAAAQPQWSHDGPVWRLVNAGHQEYRGAANRALPGGPMDATGTIAAENLSYNDKRRRPYFPSSQYKGYTPRSCRLFVDPAALGRVVTCGKVGR